jgi:type III pantothenate kinase
MKKKQMRTVIDAGNTRLKIAQFDGDDLLWVKAYDWNNDELLSELSGIHDDNIIFSSVAEEEKNAVILSQLTPDLIFSHTTQTPIDLSTYKTVDTLGLDRIANAVAANHFAENKHILVIDCGTCIKFDLVVEGNYKGGSISPGIQMRFKALNEFTGKLPLIKSESSPNTIEVIGDSSSASIKSGVMHGTQWEIEGFITHYAKNYEDLTIFLTGGDAKLFDLHNKNCIFVDSYLTLKGLLIILKHNGY